MTVSCPLVKIVEQHSFGLIGESSTVARFLHFAAVLRWIHTVRPVGSGSLDYVTSWVREGDEVLEVSR